MIKRLSLLLMSFLFAFIFLYSNLSSKKVYANDVILDISAESAYLCDANSGTFIYGKNEKERLPIASMTKIMLLLLAFEKNAKGEFDLNSHITVSKRASSMGGSQAFIEANKSYLASDLVKSIIIASANDSSVALAEHLFGNEENAVAEMNKKARELNLSDTVFSNCTGLMKPTQYSCAKDVAIMLTNLIKYPAYFKYSTIYLDKIIHPGGRETTLTNTNKLVKFYNGCDGGKTGFTNEAGFCLAATAKRGNTRIVAVLIKEKDSKTRFKDCSLCFDYAFDNFVSKKVMEKDEIYDVKVKIKNGKKDFIYIVPEKDCLIFGLKNKKENIEITFSPLKIINSPIKKGAIVGKFSIYKDNILYSEINALSNENVKKLNFFDYVVKIATA